MSDLVEIGVEAMHEARARHFGEREVSRPEERGELYRAYMAAILTAIEKAGYRIVPVIPTPEMLQAGTDKDPNADVSSTYGYAVAVNSIADTWEHMLAAAPKATP